MKTRIHEIGPVRITEIHSDAILIRNAEDGTDLLGNLYFEGTDRIILHQENIDPAFFDLKTGIAGEILQKFSNYRVKLAIVGNFSSSGSKSLDDFIRESNRYGQINFAATIEEALLKLAKA